MDQDHRIFEHGLHAVGIGDEIRAQIAAVELHALDDVEMCVRPFGFFHRDHAVFTDLVHCVGDEIAHGAVVVGGDRTDVGDVGFILYVAADFAQPFDDLLHGEVDTALQIHGIRAGHNVFEAFADDRLRKHGRGGGAVARDVAGLRCHFAKHLGAHVFDGVLKFNFLRDGDAVLCYGRRAEFFVDDDVPTLRAKRHFYCVCELVDSALERVACFRIIRDDFRCHVCVLLYWVVSNVRVRVMRVIRGSRKCRSRA